MDNIKQTLLDGLRGINFPEKDFKIGTDLAGLRASRITPRQLIAMASLCEAYHKQVDAGVLKASKKVLGKDSSDDAPVKELLQADKNVTTAFFKNNKIYMKAPFTDRDRCNLVGAKWNAAKKYWWMNDSLINRDLLSEVFPELGVKSSKKDKGDFSLLNIPGFLMPHQKKAMEIAWNHNRYGFWDDCGSGKTLEGLMIKQLHDVPFLVVCPLSVIENAWIPDCKKWTPHIKTVNLWKVLKKKKGFLKEKLKADIGVVNFESFKILLRDFPKELSHYRGLFIDESSKLGDPGSEITKALMSYADNREFVYLFSGTPGETYEKYFAQIRIIDPRTFGTNYHKFKNEWFNRGGFAQKKLFFKKELEENFLKKISEVSRVTKKSDVLKDLPEFTENIRSVELSPKERNQYVQMEKLMRAEIDDGLITAQNAGVKCMKLRQCTSGFFIDDEGVVHNFGKSKLNELDILLKEIGDKKVIIWSQYQYSGSLLNDHLKNSVLVNGTITAKQKQVNINKFKEDPSCKHLIMHPKSGGHGVDGLQMVCNYCIYYEMGYAWEEKIQSIARLHRKGQKNGITCYFLLATSSIDRVIYKAVERKDNVANTVIDYIRNSK